MGFQEFGEIVDALIDEWGAEREATWSRMRSRLARTKALDRQHRVHFVTSEQATAYADTGLARLLLTEEGTSAIVLAACAYRDGAGVTRRIITATLIEMREARMLVSTRPVERSERVEAGQVQAAPRLDQIESRAPAPVDRGGELDFERRR